MKQYDDDSELRNLIKKIQIESPGPEFKEKVMEAILTSGQSATVAPGRPLLGKSFWIIGAFFLLIILLASLIVPENSYPQAAFFRNLLMNITLPDARSFQIVIGKFTEVTGKVPMVVFATLFSASALILADRLFTFRERL
jgi:hypothetical protein